MKPNGDYNFTKQKQNYAFIYSTKIYWIHQKILRPTTNYKISTINVTKHWGPYLFIIKRTYMNG